MCKPILARMPNDPVSVFTRVKRSQDPPNKDFTRNILQNLNFRVGRDDDIRVDVHKNRRNPMDPVLVSFKVKSVHKYDIPKPVMLKRKAQENEKHKEKNIPCPYDDCEELLSRQEFRDHLNQHRERNKLSENMGDGEAGDIKVKTQEDVTNNENIIPKMAMEFNSPHGESFNDKCEEENAQSNVSLEQMDITEDSVEIVETKPGDNSLNKSKQAEKQSSILNFFKRFDPRPKDEVEEIYSKKSKKDLLSPTFKSTPKLKSIKLGKNKPIGDKPVPNIVEHFTNISTPASNRQTTPETKEENAKTKVISSPIGFFKIDQSSSINESTDRGSEEKENKGEDKRQDTHFKYFR